MTLDNVRILLGITDGTQDEVLETILRAVQARLKVLLGGVDVIPEQLEYIAEEV